MSNETELRAALKLAILHVEHMAAWIGRQQAFYSFEGLGEDMPSIKAALATPAPDQVGCHDCGCAYDAPEWVEAVVPHETWDKISPTGGHAGLLCVTCMAKRAAKLGLTDIPTKVWSGPFVFEMGQPAPDQGAEERAREVLKGVAHKYGDEDCRAIIKAGNERWLSLAFDEALEAMLAFAAERAALRETEAVLGGGR